MSAGICIDESSSQTDMYNENCNNKAHHHHKYADCEIELEKQFSEASIDKHSVSKV